MAIRQVVLVKSGNSEYVDSIHGSEESERRAIAEIKRRNKHAQIRTEQRTGFLSSDIPDDENWGKRRNSKSRRDK